MSKYERESVAPTLQMNADRKESYAIIRYLYAHFEGECPHWRRRLDEAIAPPANRDRLP